MLIYFFFLFSSEKEGIKAEFKGRKCLSVKPMLKQTQVYNLLFYFQTTTSQKTIFHLFVVSVFLHFTVIFRGFIHSLGVVNCPVTRLYVGQKYLIPFTFIHFLCLFVNFFSVYNTALPFIMVEVTVDTTYTLLLISSHCSLTHPTLVRAASSPIGTNQLDRSCQTSVASQMRTGVYSKQIGKGWQWRS